MVEIVGVSKETQTWAKAPKTVGNPDIMLDRLGLVSGTVKAYKAKIAGSVRRMPERQKCLTAKYV